MGNESVSEVRSEKVAKKETVDRNLLSPEERIGQILNQATETKKEVLDNLQKLKTESRPDALPTIQTLETQTNGAFEELQQELKEAGQAEQQEPSPLDQVDELLKSPEGLEDAKNLLIMKANEVLYEQAVCNVRDLEAVARKAQLHPELRTSLIENFQSAIGPKYAKELIDNQEFRANLEKLQASLEGTLGEDGPEICSERNLESIIVIHETLGAAAREAVVAMDLKRLIGDVEYNRNRSALMIMEKNFDPESGELVAEVSVDMTYSDGSGEENEIERTFRRKSKKNENGESEPYKSVEHKLFKVSAHHESKGYAKEVTKDSLKAYDKMGIDAITLHADIDMGGYAWASYGYGWDEDQMARKLLTSKVEKGEDLIINGKEVFDFDELSAEEQKEIGTQAIVEFTQGAKDRYVKIVREMGLVDQEGKPTSDQADLNQKLQAILDTFEDLARNPSLDRLTPQRLAEIGKDGPKFRKDSVGNWHLAENFPADAEEDHKTKGEMHAGKMALVWSDWFGQIELNPKGAQQGKNRELLEKKLSR